MDAHFRMDRTERFYKIDHLIRERGVVPVGDFLRELEVSLATFERDIEYMRAATTRPSSGIAMRAATGSCSPTAPPPSTSCRACGSARARRRRCSPCSTSSKASSTPSE